MQRWRRRHPAPADPRRRGVPHRRVHFAPPPTSIPYLPSTSRVPPTRTPVLLYPRSSHRPRSSFRPPSPLCLSLPPHPPCTPHPPFTASSPIPAFYSSPCPSSPLVTHTNPLPKPPTSRPTPAYLAACFGVSHTTLGKILLHVMSARVSTRRSANIQFIWASSFFFHPPRSFRRLATTPQNRARRDPREAADGDWLWPALWILPVDDAYGGWTLSGEIDIMEARGNEPLYPKQGINYVHSSLNWGPTALTSTRSPFEDMAGGRGAAGGSTTGSTRMCWSGMSEYPIRPTFLLFPSARLLRTILPHYCSMMLNAYSFITHPQLNIRRHAAAPHVRDQARQALPGARRLPERGAEREREHHSGELVVEWDEGGAV
ncbi:hypothetical protein C8J57DRAFT_760287 [Mycena rebaudengoi]|nr:hypothetical protein C8J57DRAFT_760287 [Mycena rebaudengoi]